MRQWPLCVLVAPIGMIVAVWAVSDSEPLRSRIAVGDYEAPRPPSQHAATKVVADGRSAFRIDPSRTFCVAFGRWGEGVLRDAFQITEDGRVALASWRGELLDGRFQYSWCVAELRLTEEQLASALKAVEANELTALAKEYLAEDIGCGTQWILRIEQGDKEKSVYCSNHFPEPMLAFVKRVDEILVAAGRNLAWRSVPWDRAYEKELWASIRQ